MPITPWINSVLLAVAVCATPAMAADAGVKAKVSPIGEAAKPQKSSDAVATMGEKDGCPVHERGLNGSMHKAGEPCPMMQHTGKMHEGCDVHDNQHDAGDHLKGKVGSTK